MSAVLLLAFLLAPVLVLGMAALFWPRRPVQRIEEAAPIFPHDHPIACLGCGHVHKGHCMNAALWEEDL